MRSILVQKIKNSKAELVPQVEEAMLEQGTMEKFNLTVYSLRAIESAQYVCNSKGYLTRKSVLAHLLNEKNREDTLIIIPIVFFIWYRRQ